MTHTLWHKIFVLLAFGSSVLFSCESTDSSNEGQTEKSKPTATKNTKPHAKSAKTQKAEEKSGTSDDATQISKTNSGPKTIGAKTMVTTSLVNDGGLEGSISETILKDSLAQLDELSRKEQDNVPLLVTYISFLRLYGQNPTLQADVEKKAGTYGSKDFWYLIEASYSAMSRRDLSFADYLLDKCAVSLEDLKKKGGDAGLANAALNHAIGVRVYLDGKLLEAIVKMREKEAEQPYLPSLLTTGYLSLRAGDYEGAERTFKIATSIAPNSLNARMGLGISYRVKGKTSEAISLWQSIYKSNSKDRRILWNYILALADGDNGSKKQALDFLDKYFQLEGSFPEVDAKANALITKLGNALASQSSSSTTTSATPTPSGIPTPKK